MQEHGIFPAQLFQAFTFGGSLSYPLNKGVAEDMPLTTGSPLLIILALFLWEVMCYRGRLRARNKDYDWREQITLAGMMILALVSVECGRKDSFDREGADSIPVRMALSGDRNCGRSIAQWLCSSKFDLHSIRRMEKNNNSCTVCPYLSVCRADE